jgi:hypothetical protein
MLWQQQQRFGKKVDVTDEQVNRTFALPLLDHQRSMSVAASSFKRYLFPLLIYVLAMSSQNKHLILSMTPFHPDLKNNRLKHSQLYLYNQLSSYENNHCITLLSHLCDTLIRFLSYKTLSAHLHFVERIANLWKLTCDNWPCTVGTQNIIQNDLLLAL